MCKCDNCLYNKNCQFLLTHKDNNVDECTAFYGWIDVNEELPEIEAEKTRFDQTVKRSIRVLCVCRQKSGKLLVKEGYYEWFNWSEQPSWRIPGSIDSVTHWMPLPKPPEMDS